MSQFDHLGYLYSLWSLFRIKLRMSQLIKEASVQSMHVCPLAPSSLPPYIQVVIILSERFQVLIFTLKTVKSWVMPLLPLEGNSVCSMFTTILQITVKRTYELLSSLTCRWSQCRMVSLKDARVSHNHVSTCRNWCSGLFIYSSSSER